MNGKIVKNLLTVIGLTFLIGSLNVYSQTTNKAEFKLHCGWFENPTPANYSLYDCTGEWIFGVQGGYQLEDFEILKFKEGQWLEARNVLQIYLKNNGK